MKEYELARNRAHTEETKLRLAKHLLQSQAFDNFMAKKFATVKRYGAEGAESMMAFFDEVVNSCGNLGIEEVVIGMTHRGRLNLLTGLFQLSQKSFFHKVYRKSSLEPLLMSLCCSSVLVLLFFHQ